MVVNICSSSRLKVHRLSAGVVRITADRERPTWGYWYTNTSEGDRARLGVLHWFNIPTFKYLWGSLVQWAEDEVSVVNMKGYTSVLILHIYVTNI